jgi:hypothetical protein
VTSSQIFKEASDKSIHNWSQTPHYQHPTTTCPSSASLDFQEPAFEAQKMGLQQA